MTDTRTTDRPAFTKGPWTVEKPLTSSRRIFMPDDTVEIRVGRGLIACLYRCNWTGDHGQDEANARLIAAAPAMYEALQDIVEQATRTQMMLPTDLSDSIRVFGRAALALADGRGK